MFRRLYNTLFDKMRSRLGLALLALALLVNIVALLAADKGTEMAKEVGNLAVHSRNVTAEILSVQALLLEAESAQRGFLYTANEVYLKPLNANEARIASTFAKLRDMLADNASQQERLKRMRAVAIEKMVELNKTIAIQKMGQKDIARALVMGDLGAQLMTEFDAETARFLLQEEKVLQGRIQRGADIQLAIRWGFATILFINAMMILAGAVAIMRGLARELDRDQADLVQQGERDAAEVVQQVKRDAAEVVQQDKRDAAELMRHDEREAVSAAEVEVRAVELRALTAHLLNVHEDERRKIAHDLHDELGGTLSAVKMDILMGRDAAAKHSDTKSVARLQRALTAIDTGIQFIRHLIETLRPTLLDNLGFEPALRALVGQFQERNNIRCAIALPPGELKLTPAQSTALYRVCQEALTNVMKYAKAKKVTITLANDGERWTLILVDDGVGLAATQQHRAMSHGLLGMRERMVALGGTFDIRGEAGVGTTLRATFPMGEHAEVMA